MWYNKLQSGKDLPSCLADIAWMSAVNTVLDIFITHQFYKSEIEGIFLETIWQQDKKKQATYNSCSIEHFHSFIHKPA